MPLGSRAECEQERVEGEGETEPPLERSTNLHVAAWRMKQSKMPPIVAAGAAQRISRLLEVCVGGKECRGGGGKAASRGAGVACHACLI